MTCIDVESELGLGWDMVLVQPEQSSQKTGSEMK